MNKGVDMYKKCEYNNSVISESKLQKELDTHYV